MALHDGSDQPRRTSVTYSPAALQKEWQRAQCIIHHATNVLKGSAAKALVPYITGQLQKFCVHALMSQTKVQSIV